MCSDPDTTVIYQRHDNESPRRDRTTAEPGTRGRVPCRRAAARQVRGAVVAVVALSQVGCPRPRARRTASRWPLRAAILFCVGRCVRGFERERQVSARRALSSSRCRQSCRRDLWRMSRRRVIPSVIGLSSLLPGERASQHSQSDAQSETSASGKADGGAARPLISKPTSPTATRRDA